MTFNSLTFAAFLAIVLVVYWAVPAKVRNAVLVVASYVFYGWWDWRFLSLIAVSTVADFFIGRQIHSSSEERRRKAFLWLSVGVNLGILGVFKYYDFFVESAAGLLDDLGVQANPSTLGLLLPVGISFYTFQTISYSFDVYRRRIEPTTNIVTFATYVAYFPQLVAGPIERAQRLLPQIENQNRTFPNADRRWEATRLILLGLAKKVVLADGVAGIVNDGFGDPESMSWLALVAAAVGFSIQIYGDFSGYSAIARGVSRLLGIELVLNFSQPYLSRNITEFWRRWHISLSDWLRDYLYIPLGGNRGSALQTYRNLALTMVLGGLWHGASWNFVIWGGLHGLFLIAHRLVAGGRVPAGNPRLADVGRIVVCNVAVMVAWVFFRADTFDGAWAVIWGIVSGQSGRLDGVDALTIAGFALATLVMDLVERRHHNSSFDAGGTSTATTTTVTPRRELLRGAGAAALVLAIVIFSGDTPVPFLYFQF